MTTRFTFTIPIALLNLYRRTAEASGCSITELIVRVLSGLQPAPRDKSDDAEIARIEATIKSWQDARAGRQPAPKGTTK